jgi:creatinine amidohydrolase
MDNKKAAVNSGQGMASKREVRYERLRPAELRAEMKKNSFIYVPVGPLEWHGPHLPIGTDPLIAQEVAIQAAAITGGVVLPTIFVGTERERTPELLQDLGFKGDEYIIGMDFPKNIVKSLYYPEEFLAILVRETLELLIQQGYRKIAIMNGHGADNQKATLSRVSAEFTGRGPAHVITLFPYSEASEDALGVGHAGSDETSRMMAAFPDSVDLKALPPIDQPLYNLDWAIVDDLTFHGQPSPDFTTRDDPRKGASAALGETSLEKAVNDIVAEVKSIFNLP